jgi:glucans biosynthesis protein C
MVTETTPSQRRYELDWLRVLVILAIFIFHSGRFFDQMNWHVKSAAVYPGVQAWSMFLSGWLMPMVFVISGASLFYALGKGSFPGFARDKVLRLLIPFVVGAFTHIALQVYLDRITHNQFSGSFFAFYPHYFNGLYGYGGNFAWMGLHLWYLQVLFIFSLAVFPLFYLLKGPAYSLLTKIGNFIAVPGVIFLLMVPVFWLFAVLNPQSFMGQRNFGGWPLPIYLLYLIYGFVIFSNARLQEHIRKMRVVYLAGALAVSVVIFWLYGYLLPPKGTPSVLYFGLLYMVGSWCWILTFIGFSLKTLNTKGAFLQYANEAVLPFYIMHQTVLLLFGYLILPRQIPSPVKWFLIAVSSFAVVLGLYEFAVRRFNVLRILFGMKPLSRAKKQ